MSQTVYNPVSSKRPQHMNAQLPPLELPGELSAKTSSAYAKTFGVSEDGNHPDGSIRQAISTQELAAGLWGSFNDIRTKRSPEDTAAAHIGKLNNSYREMQKKINQKVDEAERELDVRLTDLEAEADKRLMGAPTDDAGEIRSVLRELPPDDRYQAVMAAIKTNDTATMNAVFNGRAITVGLTPDQLFNLKQYAKKELCGDIAKNQELVKKARTLLGNVRHHTEKLGKTAAGSSEIIDRFTTEAVAADTAALDFIARLKAD